MQQERKKCERNWQKVIGNSGEERITKFRISTKSKFHNYEKAVFITKA